MSGAGALNEADRERLALASARALSWHGEQTRKQTDIPYLSHLLQVAGLVLEHGGDTSQAVAALLHDSLEDAADAADRAAREAAIERDFGSDVLGTVVDCTDTTAGESIDDKAPWRERKTRFLAQLSQVDERSLLVVACDKRHNLHALVWDLRLQGLAHLDRFNAGLDEQLWYFDQLVGALEGRVPERLHRELAGLHEDLRAVAEAR